MLKKLMVCAVLGVAAIGCGPDVDTLAQEIQAAGEVSFAADVQPITSVKCAPCHIAERKKNYSIKDYASALEKNGVIVPGDSATTRRSAPIQQRIVW